MNNIKKFLSQLFTSLRSYYSEIKKVDSSVAYTQTDFKKVLERNIFLEQEISARIEELEKAKKSIVSLELIWHTIKSSEPLSAVLNVITESLVHNLAYEFAFVSTFNKNQENKELSVTTSTKTDLKGKIENLLSIDFEYVKIPLTKGSSVFKALQTSEIQVIDNVVSIFCNSNNFNNENGYEELKSLLDGKKGIIIPLTVQDKPFGVLIGISRRDNINLSEMQFFSIFANQVELAVTIAKLFEKIKEQAVTDSLTGLANRRFFEQNLNVEVERSLRLGQPFTIIAIDMDYLKLINDRLGHSAGDEAICHVSKVISENARNIDLPARLGGEEFCIILPGIDVEGGLIAAERIRSSIEKVSIPKIGRISVSIGVATFLTHTSDIAELLELADRAMYKAKKTGRNKVVCATDNLSVDWQSEALNTFINVLSQQHAPITPDIANALMDRLSKSSNVESAFVDILNSTVDQLIAISDKSRKVGQARFIFEYSVELAKKVGLNRATVDNIKLASLLHDLGKMLVPEHILSKETPLTEEERKYVESHPVKAVKDILEPIGFADMILPIIEHHHERWDGSGYPKRLSGHDIPIGARIIHIIDSYCAMVTDKPYREAKTKQEAIQTLQEGAGSIWDQQLVEEFINILNHEEEPATL